MQLKYKNLTSYPFFLFLLPLFFVLHGCAENFPLISFVEGASLFAMYSLLAAGLVVLFFFLFRSWPKAFLYAFFILGIQLFFGPLHDWLKQVFSTSFPARYSFLLPLFFLLLAVGFFFLRRTSRSLLRIKTYLNVLLVVLLIVDLVVILSKATTYKPPVKQPAKTACTNCRKPNYYLIIADEYAGRKELQDLFKFDNAVFEKSLRQKGFQVISFPRSNYNYTPYSMASLFQTDYLQGITSRSSDFDNRKIIFQAINNNEVIAAFANLGYQFYNFSLFDFANIPPERNSNNFYQVGKRILTSQTLTSRIKQDLWYHVLLDFNSTWAQDDYLNSLKEDIRFGYEGTVAEAAAESSRPKFIYTHFIMPHYPYLYDENGKPLSYAASMENNPASYLGYLKYCNQFCSSLIDEIIRRDKSSPVIILMSDHGYTKYPSTNDSAYNFTNMINVYNLKPLPDSLTNVNLFRYILNNEFGAGLPILKDSTVFLTE